MARRGTFTALPKAILLLLTLWFAAAVGALSDAKPAVAQNAPATGAPARPEDLRALSDLLAKPEIQAWLKLQGEAPSPAPDQKSP